MREIPLHPFALLGAAAARMALGALWYSPALFLKPWMAMTGIREESLKKGFGKKIGGDIVGSILMTFAMLHAIRYADVTSVPWGMAVGFLNWLGFVAVATISAVTYEGRPFKLFLLHNSYNLVSLMIMGAILAVWG